MRPKVGAVIVVNKKKGLKNEPSGPVTKRLSGSTSVKKIIVRTIGTIPNAIEIYTLTLPGV